MIHEDTSDDMTDITSKDVANMYKTMFLSGISKINFALYAYNMESYSKVISQMNECYKNIESEKIRNDVSSLINDANKKYINRKKQDTDMGLDEFLEFIINGIDISKNMYKGATETKYKCDFSLDLNIAMTESRINKTESKILNKIFDYHIFARYAKEKYGDQRAYLAMQKECVNAYKTIESNTGKEILLKYISPEFLKTKSKKL